MRTAIAREPPTTRSQCSCEASRLNAWPPRPLRLAPASHSLPTASCAATVARGSFTKSCSAIRTILSPLDTAASSSHPAATRASRAIREKLPARGSRARLHETTTKSWKAPPRSESGGDPRRAGRLVGRAARRCGAAAAERARQPHRALPHARCEPRQRHGRSHPRERQCRGSVRHCSVRRRWPRGKSLRAHHGVVGHELQRESARAGRHCALASRCARDATGEWRKPSGCSRAARCASGRGGSGALHRVRPVAGAGRHEQPRSVQLSLGCRHHAEACTVKRPPTVRVPRGLSLIELMVALTIGSILIVGALYMYDQGRSSFALNERIARLQDDGRYVISVIEPDLEL